MTFFVKHTIMHLLLSIYTDMIMVEAMEDVKEAVRVGVELLKDVKFAGD